MRRAGRRAPFLAGLLVALAPVAGCSPGADIFFIGGIPDQDVSVLKERFDKLRVEARAELNTVKRREMYAEMQRILRDEGGLVCPVFANQVFVTTDKVQVPDKIGGNWGVDGYKNTERWSFA